MGHGEEVAKQLNPASIDCLPDDLLVQILSLLPTKQAVSTSLLSKRWRTLFAFSHNLDFDDEIDDFTSRLAWYTQEKHIRKSFRDFVDTSLAFQVGKHIKKFSLKLTERDEDQQNVDRWICNAMEHGVSELHLHIDSLWFRYYPSKVFTSTTLVKLSLKTRSFIPRLDCPRLPPRISLPALKVLLLDSSLFEKNQLANVFLAACPALEDFTIRYKYYPEFSYVITSKTIKKLSVTLNCYGCNDSSGVITLDTPSVVDLYYSDYPRHESPIFHLDSLAKATLDLHFLKDDIQQVHNDADVTDLINGIRNVKTLHLTSSAVEVMSVCCKGGLPMFNNLVELFFKSKKRGWRVFLPLLLERCPNLKTLVLSGLYRYTFGRRRFVGVRIPPNNQVKRLSIRKYKGSENELEHISHLLLNMECLEMVKVYVVAAEMDDLEKMQLTEDILKLPTASPKIQIQIM